MGALSVEHTSRLESFAFWIPCPWASGYSEIHANRREDSFLVSNLLIFPEMADEGKGRAERCIIEEMRL